VNPAHLQEISRYRTETEVIEIRELVASGNSVRLVAEKYGTSPANISEIARGLKYRDMGGPRTSNRRTGSETHCVNGHLWAEHGSLVDEYSPTRHCRACQRDRARIRRSRTSGLSE
jgi:hypothetical protein